MAVHFTHNQDTLTMNIVPELTGLYRVNAMTHYTVVKPYMVSAHYLNDKWQPESDVLFYQVYTLERGWVQISKELGDELLMHPLIRKTKLPSVNTKNLIVASFIVASSMGLISSLRKK